MANPLTALKNYRASHNPRLSQAALASELGVTRETVARWETGERKIGTSFLPGISAKTGIPVKELRPDLAELMGEFQ